MLAWATYVISLSVPAVRTEGLLFTPEYVSGIDAASSAPWTGAYGVVSALTNLLFLSTIVSLIRRKPSAAIGVLLIGSAFLNLGWLQEPPPSNVIYEGLLFGYYLWIFSYLLMGLAQFASGWRQTA